MYLLKKMQNYTHVHVHKSIVSMMIHFKSDLLFFVGGEEGFAAHQDYFTNFEPSQS